MISKDRDFFSPSERLCHAKCDFSIVSTVLRVTGSVPELEEGALLWRPIERVVGGKEDDGLQLENSARKLSIDKSAHIQST